MITLSKVCTAFTLIFLLVSSADAVPDIKEKTVTYSAQGVEMKGYLVYDGNISGRRPGVLVVHEWWGLNDYARMRARMLAKLGYAALALDMYGGDTVADHPDEAGKFSSELIKNFDVAKARFIAGMDFLKNQPVADPIRIGAIGYCFGGGIVLNMARQNIGLRGVASFHGSLTPSMPATSGSIKAKILVLNGEADSFVTPEQIKQFKQEMKAAGADYRFISYPSALHGFTNPEADTIARKFNLPIGYNADADTKSWEALEKFLKDIFKK
jgi:dienelactone hydrolase